MSGYQSTKLLSCVQIEMFFFHKLREAEAAEDIRRPDDDATVDAFVIFVTRLGSLSSGSTKAHFRILHIK